MKAIRFFFALVFAVFLFSSLTPPIITYGQTSPSSTPTPPTNGNTTDIGPPWGSGPETVEDVIENVTNWVLGIAGSLAVLFIIISGIRYITSAGNQSQHEAAKKNLTSAIIGLVIVLIAFVIVQIISSVLTKS